MSGSRSRLSGGLGPGLHDRHLRAGLFEKGRDRVEVAGVVVDHQELHARDGPVTQLHAVPVGRWACAGEPGGHDLRRRHGGSGACVVLRVPATTGPGGRMGSWTVKVLPCPGVLTHVEGAAEEADELAADREAESGAAVQARGGPVPLGEGLEDPSLLLVVDADAGVADREGQLSSSGREPMCTCTPPRSVNLNALARRFLRIWRSRWGSVTRLCGEVRRQVDRVVEPLLLGDWPELAEQPGAQLLEGDLLVLGRHGPGLDLGQVEDAVQELEQLVAR